MEEMEVVVQKLNVEIEKKIAEVDKLMRGEAGR